MAHDVPVHPGHCPKVVDCADRGIGVGSGRNVLAGLRTDRLNLLRRSITISEALTEVRGEIHIGPPKTPAARRTIAIPRSLTDILSVHMSRYPTTIDGSVSSADNGGPLRRTNFRARHWTQAINATVGPPCRFRDLRHTHAALLIAHGEHAKATQVRMGHASIKTTFDVYGHLFDGHDEELASRLDELMIDRPVGLAWG